MSETASTIIRHVKLISLNHLGVRNTHYLHLSDTSSLFQVDALINPIIIVVVKEYSYRIAVLLVDKSSPYICVYSDIMRHALHINSNGFNAFERVTAS